MKIRIQDLKMKPDHTQDELTWKIKKILRIKNEPFRYQVVRRSIDARKKPEIYYIYTLDVSAAHPERYVKNQKKGGREKLSLLRQNTYQFPFRPREAQDGASPSPVIVGSGPAGLFCALMLQEQENAPSFWSGDSLWRSVRRQWRNSGKQGS